MVIIGKFFCGRPSLYMRDVMGRISLFALNVFIILLALSCKDNLTGLVFMVNGQFQKGSPLYKQAIQKEKMHLYEKISRNPDVNLYFHPENAYISNNGYIYDYPNPEQYRISMLIDPCRFQENPG